MRAEGALTTGNKLAAIAPMLDGLGFVALGTHFLAVLAVLVALVRAHCRPLALLRRRHGDFGGATVRVLPAIEPRLEVAYAFRSVLQNHVMARDSKGDRNKQGGREGKELHGA